MTAFRWQLLLPLLLVRSCHGQGQSLAEGRFQTTTDVTSWLNLALDAADMRESTDPAVKKDIYLNGKNAIFTEDGVEKRRTFAGLSLNSYPLMADDAMYNIYRHAFLKLGNEVEGETLGEFDQKPVQEYADTLVNDLFDLNIEHIETEAALVANLWMAIIHELYDVQRGCLAKDANAMNAALDRAAAMWIGADQPQGAVDKGNLLYNLAQVAALPFNQANGEAAANKLLLDSMTSVQQDIKDGTCNSGETGYLQMRNAVNRMIDYMSIPLVQMLIHRIQQQTANDSSEFVELYALSIAPRVAACDPDNYQDIENLMVTGGLDNDDDKAYAIEAVQWSLSCLGLTCEDIGSYESGEVKACITQDFLPGDAFAGYFPSSDVGQYSMIDRDILQIRILARTHALEAAMDYYKYGMNVKLTGSGEGELLSLQSLATAESRSVAAEQFVLFTNYFGSNDYADKKISDVLTSVSPYDRASDAQRAELVAGYLTNMVIYMAVLQTLNEAANACDDTGADAALSLTLLDRAAAYYVGSIEEDLEDGLDGGQLLFAASKALCGNFSKCMNAGISEANNQILNAFDDMSDNLLVGACDEVITTLTTIIEPFLVVPLIQGTLHYAAVNAKLPQGSNEASLGTADAFAFSIVPFVNDVDATLGASLMTNLQFQPDKSPVSDGAESVFEIFRTALPALPSLSLTCSQIGQYPVYGSVCSGGSPTPTYSPVGSSDSTPSDAPAPTVPTPAPAPTAVAFGRYEFSSDISIAGLALDVRDMRNAADRAVATDVYSNGANVRGGPTGTISLASLSLDASSNMKDNLDYNLFRFALASEEEFGDGSCINASAYADTTARKAFEVATDQELAAEAAVVLHVMMEIANYLHAAVKLCEAGDNAVEAVDKAVAIWVGVGQTEGSDDNGYLVYSIAEQAASRLGIAEDDESWVNTALFDAFNEAKNIALECPANRDKFLDLRGLVADIIQALASPLVHNLIYYISQADSSSPDYTTLENYVELYALSVVPRLIGCSPASFFYLQTKLIDEDFDTTKIDDEFVSHMQRLQKCYDVECIDLKHDQISDASLKAMVQKLCYNETTDPRSIAGYSPANDVSEYLMLDLDVIQIGILAECEAFPTALDVYTYGYNGRTPDEASFRALSFKSLATSSGREIVPDQFKQFLSYYGSDSFADNEITAALLNQGTYVSASVSQRREVAIRMLQGMVSYMSLLTNLYTALDKCVKGENATIYWDRAVALFVGSIEGEIRGGDPDGDGELLYALGKEVCEVFDTCESSMDASSNEVLLDSFSVGLDLIDEKQCGSVERHIKTEILPLLPVSLIQGTLMYSTSMENLPAGTTDPDLATGYALSRAILPLVSASNSTSAETISASMAFQLTSDPVSDGSPAIFNAITYALYGMGVDCKQIGTFDNNGTFDNQTLCSDDLSPHPSTSTDLGEGLYTTTTYVQDRANIALDVLGIKNALSDGSVDLAKDIYVEGENSEIYDENGIKNGTRTLSGFSTKAPTEMKDEPLYNIFLYALQDEQGKFLGKDVGLYADTLVNEAFGNANSASQLLAAEAVVVYNVWMYVAHELYQTLRKCKDKSITDVDGVQSIDEAAVYWIGESQVTGDAEKGHLLYALSEEMGERFGLDESGQSRTNTNILRLFNQAKLELSLPTACTDDPGTHPRLFQIVNKIVSWMTVPLVQGLIHNLRQNDKDRVKLYARAFWPLVAGCSEVTFTALKDKLMNANYNVIEVDDIIARIETTYECLGFTCDDVGVHEDQTKQTCLDIPVLNKIAGYAPQTDVRSFALLDLDILETNILMQMGAIGAAEDLYINGKHADVTDENGFQTLSLYQLATSSQRSVVPQFDSFKRYYDDDDKYADTIIRAAFVKEDASAEQRQEMVVKGMQYLVLYMATAQEMYQAVAYCSSTNPAEILDAEEAWDRAAAYLIGSLEGSKEEGSLEGLSFYALARERCEQFGTCTKNGTASWNDELNTLLYTGRGAVTARACGEVRRATTEIETLMLVPLIQSTLHYANANAQLEKGTDEGDLGAGFIFSRAVLPLVEDSDRESADTINVNMDFQPTQKPVQGGAAAVWNAFARAYGRMGVECELVGNTSSFDACTGATSPEEESQKSDNVGMIVGIVVGILAVLGIIVFVYYYDKKKKKKYLDENRPKFVAPKGELNHTPDQMEGGTYTHREDYDLEDENYNDPPPASPQAEGTSSMDTSQAMDTSQDSEHTID